MFLGSCKSSKSFAGGKPKELGLIIGGDFPKLLQKPTFYYLGTYDSLEKGC